MHNRIQDVRVFLEHENIILEGGKCQTDGSELLENSKRFVKLEVGEELHDFRVVGNEPEVEEQLSVSRDNSTRACLHRPATKFELES